MQEEEKKEIPKENINVKKEVAEGSEELIRTRKRDNSNLYSKLAFICIFCTICLFFIPMGISDKWLGTDNFGLYHIFFNASFYSIIYLLINYKKNDWVKSIIEDVWKIIKIFMDFLRSLSEVNLIKKLVFFLIQLVFGVIKIGVVIGVPIAIIWILVRAIKRMFI